MPATNMLDDIANDLAIWIDSISTDIAVAFAASRSPFSAHVTEEQKLEFYRTRLFNPDGSPNAQGRQEELERVGTDGFAQILKAVVKRWPELRPPEPAPIEVPQEWPTAPPPGLPIGPPGLPVGLPPGPVGSGPPMPGPLAGGLPVPPRPPMMPPPMAR